MVNKIELEFTEQPISIGIGEKDRRQVCKGLSKILADCYFLGLKTQNYHWNVTGKMFWPLHKIFEEQYQDLALSIDEIAERIRTLGEFAPGSFSTFSKITSIKEETGVPVTEGMILHLIQGNEIVVSTAREVITICDEAQDDVTIDLLISLMKKHEKNAWILRSILSANRSH